MEKTLLEIAAAAWLHRLLDSEPYNAKPLEARHVGSWDGPGTAGVWIDTGPYIVGVTIEAKVRTKEQTK